MSIKKFTVNSAQVASFKEALTKGKQGSGGGNPNFLKLEAPKTKKKNEPALVYKLRLIPHKDDVENNVLEKSIFHYKSHGWKSNKTGQWVTDNICPTSFGESFDSNPLILYSIQEYKKLKEAGIVDKEHPLRKALLKLGTKENWLVNVYVINDPVTPENNGTVKILRMGKNLNDLVLGALENDLFGPRIFSLAEDGCTFRISVGWNGDGDTAFQTYAGSMFEQVGTAISGLKDTDSIYSNYIDMPSQFVQKSRDELKALLNEHYLSKPEVGSGDVDSTDNSHKVQESPKPVNSAKKVSHKKESPKVEPKKLQEGEDNLDMDSSEPVDADLDEFLKSIPE